MRLADVTDRRARHWSWKNDLCNPVPHPDEDIDWLHMTLSNSENLVRWLDDPALMHWLDSSRLDLLGHLRPRLPADAATRSAVVEPLKARLTAVNGKLEALLAASV